MATTTRRRWRSPKPRRQQRAPAAGQGAFRLLRLLVVLLFLVLLGQLVRMQVVEGERYRELAAINALREVQVPAARGLIYDRQGRPLVYNEPRYAAAVVPGDLPAGQEETVYEELGRIIGMAPGEIRARVTEARGRASPYVPLVLKEDLDRNTALALKEREPDLPGVRLVVQSTRRYVEGPLMAHVLGYMGPISSEEYQALRDQGYTMHDWLGKAGVEASYESLLRGEPGRRLVEVDASGRERRVVSERAPVDGANLVLTVDLDLQRKVAEALQQHMGRSENAAAAVMDVRTGEVLALVSLPTFDPNIFSRPLRPEELAALTDNPGKPLLNHATAENFAPGSTFKTIVAAAALQEGVARPDTTFVSQGYIVIPNEIDPNAVYVCEDWSRLGRLDMYRALAMSSNVYFYYLAGARPDEFRGLGPDRLANYARAFGLGEPTGIDLPAEVAGTVPDPRWKERTIGEPWYLGNTCWFAIGEEYLRATPLQMLVAVGAIANGGQLLQPHLLREARDASGHAVRTAQREVKRMVPVSPQNLEVVRQGMVMSVESGVAQAAAVRGVKVAGKTGTAEFGEPDAQGRLSTHGWFVGFAPADDPLVAVVVFMRRGSGGQDAAPAAAKILDYIFNGSDLAQRLRAGRP